MAEILVNGEWVGFPNREKLMTDADPLDEQEFNELVAERMKEAKGG